MAKQSKRAGKGKQAKADIDAGIWARHRAHIEVVQKYVTQGNNSENLTKYQLIELGGLKAMVEGDFEESYRALERMVRHDMDPYVFAFLDVDEERGVYRRVYSSRPDELPVTDDMPLPDKGIWMDSVVVRRQVMYSNSLTRAASVIPDSAECLAMGCLCYGYVPIAPDGANSKILGVLAIFGKTNFFSDKNMKTLASRRLHFLTYLDALRLARKFETPAA